MVSLQSFFTTFLTLLLINVLVSLIFLIFYYLSYLLSSLGSALLFLVVFYLSSRALIQMLIFPGSFSFWSKPVIKNYSKIVNFSLRHQANEFCSNIENLKSKNKSHLCFDLLTALDTLFNIFYILQTTVAISKKQNQVKEILEIILKDLHLIQLDCQGGRISLRDWYEKRPCGIEKCKFVEETLVVSQGFVQLDKVLKQDSEIFASLNYMRADLIYSYNSSNFNITTPDKTTLDW